MSCSTSIIGNKATTTAQDIFNANLYAKNRLLKEKTEKLIAENPGIGIKWVDRFTSSQVPYHCPKNLTCNFGNARITTRDECLKYSELPYKNDEKGSILTEEERKQLKHPYLEWRIDPRGDTEPRCYFGNPLMRRWCEKPKSRTFGETDVPPFNYCVTGQEEGCQSDIGQTPSEKIGKCVISQEYCSRKGLYYSTDDGPHCYQTGAGTFFETLFGSTITRGLFEGGCSSKLSDRRYKENITMVAKDYGGDGINLYTFNYNGEAMKMHPEYKMLNIGFMADEIEKVYPDIITTNEKGIKYIKLDSQKSKELGGKAPRIYNTMIRSNVILPIFLQFLNHVQNKNESKGRK